MLIIAGNVVVIDRLFGVHLLLHKEVSNFVDFPYFLELPLVTAILHIFAYDVVEYISN